MASTIDINCPLNTTECIFQAVVALLDQVREKNAEFNWDPLSFGFTAVTGVAAACFAAITIVQALFAAGPGRLKSSRYAIGPWAKFTRHFFDPQEWRFRSLAQTPVIVFSSQDGVGDQHKYFIAGSSELRPAGWNALLSHLRLDKPEFWGRKPTGADHLLQDLSAVPAVPALLKDELGTRSSLEDILLLLYKAVRIWELEKPPQTIDGWERLLAEPAQVLRGSNFAIPPEDLHPLDDLIIYRALLMATLLSLPVDTSPLLNNEMYQQIVPFL
ncbi:hypothetical protein NEMBOFW57_006651 [Staphylotrichum longicolle]|uniref:Uncharacterized protein n=1 Tax=Staphylotrichum longicolle TaxID=669026 RepID=A0AAD4HXM7_9PEZI|nr:hypothetical protein NEMBOFW57_006651 [Staphylotrichum longicolle]